MVDDKGATRCGEGPKPDDAGLPHRRASSVEAEANQDPRLDAAVRRLLAAVGEVDISMEDKLSIVEEMVAKAEKELCDREFSSRAVKHLLEMKAARRPYKREPLWPDANVSDYLKEALHLLTSRHPGLADLARPQNARPWAAWGQAIAALAAANAKNDGRSISINPKMRRNFLEDPDRREQILAFLAGRTADQLSRGQ